jgi:tight adherence protein C
MIGPGPAAHPRSIAERIGAVPVLLRLAGPRRIRALVERAGTGRTVAEVAGRKWLWAGAGLVCTAWFLSPALAPFVAFVASRIPDMHLARDSRRRWARADRELPLLLDLLAAGVTAGLTGQLAARRAVEATRGPLSEELAVALRRVDLGGRWRDELPAAAERLDLPDLRRAAAVLTRSETLGSSLAGALGDIARDARETRRALVAERARKAPVKMLFPLVFLVLPAFLLLTVVPVLVTTLQSIR